MLCNGTVWIPSERVVPRVQRAEWLEKHGSPAGRLAFEVTAPARVWAAAGCHLTVDGKVKRVSKEAIDALCIPARDLVRERFPNNKIARTEAEQALKTAASRRRRILEDKERKRQIEKQALLDARTWVADHGSAEMRKAVLEGADARKMIVEHIWRCFVQFLGIDPLIVNPKEIETRYNPSAFSIEIRASLIETVKEFEFPPFVRIHVLEVSRLDVPGRRHFVTVVPIKFEIPGCTPTIVVWDGEKRI